MGINEKAWGGGFKRVKGTETAEKTIAIAIEDTSKQLHILDIGLSGTDLGVSADTYPTLYIHGTASVSEYAKMYTDSTDFHIQVVGGNVLLDAPSSGDVTLQINSTDEYKFDATTFTISGGNIIDFTGTATIRGSSTLILSPGSAHYLAVKGSSSWLAGSLGTVSSITQTSPVGSLSVHEWLRINDLAGSLLYIPAFIQK